MPEGGWKSLRRFNNGWIPKRPKGPDCKSGGIAFAGSNPAPPMPVLMGMERIGTWLWSDRGGGQREPPWDCRVPPGLGDPGTCREWTATNRGCNSMVEYLPSKQATWVRFP